MDTLKNFDKLKNRTAAFRTFVEPLDGVEGSHLGSITTDIPLPWRLLKLSLRSHPPSQSTSVVFYAMVTRSIPNRNDKYECSSVAVMDATFIDSESIIVHLVKFPYLV